MEPHPGENLIWTTRGLLDWIEDMLDALVACDKREPAIVECTSDLKNRKTQQPRVLAFRVDNHSVADAVIRDCPCLLRARLTTDPYDADFHRSKRFLLIPVCPMKRRILLDIAEQISRL